jgi:hypothetical protein
MRSIRHSDSHSAVPNEGREREGNLYSEARERGEKKNGMEDST